jgi:hypothetical protein
MTDKEVKKFPTFFIVKPIPNFIKIHRVVLQTKHTMASPLYVHYIPYILESNPRPVFGDFLNEKMLVRDSNPHLSFNHPLPTGRLIE